MKVLGINASPKGSKSETLKLVKAVLEGAKSEGAKVEFVDLCKLDIKYCNACGVCHKRGKCSKKDDFQSLYKKVLAADGLVMGSPNYFMSVTAQMKTLIDRMAEAIHCQLLIGKYSVAVATAGGLGQEKDVTDYLNKVMLNFGSFVTGSVGLSVRLGPEAFADAEKKAFKLGKKLTEDIRIRKIYKQQRRIHEGNRKYFRDLVIMYKDEWTHEYEFWMKSKGRK